MSRSAERRAAATVVAGALVGCLVAATAAADPRPADSATPAAASSSQPASVQPRVATIRARSEVLHANVVDLGGTARVSTAPGRIAVTLNSNILFGKDSAVIQPKAGARLAEVGAQLKAAGPGQLQITGYTDDLGSAEHGLELSTQRASAVRKALGASLAGKTISVTGKGEADSLVPNKDEASRAQNRRVEIIFTKK